MPAVSPKATMVSRSQPQTNANLVQELTDQRAKLTENIRTFISRRVERDDLWKDGVTPRQRVDLIIDYAYELPGAEADLKVALVDPGLAERDIRFVRLLTMQWSDATTRLDKLTAQPQPDPVTSAALPKARKPVSKVSAPKPPTPKPRAVKSVQSVPKPLPTPPVVKRAQLSTPSVPARPQPQLDKPPVAVESSISVPAQPEKLMSELEAGLGQGLRDLWQSKDLWLPAITTEQRWSLLVDVILEPTPEHTSALTTALSVSGKATVLKRCDALRQALRDLYAHPEFAKLSQKVEAQLNTAQPAKSTDWVAEFVPESELDKLFTELDGLLNDEQKLKVNESRAKDIFTQVQKTLSESREQLDDEYEFLGLTPLERQLVLFRLSDYRRRYRSHMRHLRQALRELHGQPADTAFPAGVDDVALSEVSATPMSAVPVTDASSVPAIPQPKKSVGDTLERVLDYVASGWDEAQDKQQREAEQLDALAREHSGEPAPVGVDVPEPKPLAYVPEDSSVRLPGQTIPQVLEQAIKAHPERYGADMSGNDLEQYLYGRTLALRLSAPLGGAKYAFTPKAVGVVQVFPELQESEEWAATLALSGKRSTLETLLKDGYLQQK